MGFLDILKKKKKEDIDFNGDIVKLINKGILFEDEQEFIKWKEPVGEIKKRVKVSERLFADRAVYNWGERSILKGLKLPLTTVFWYNNPDSDGKLLRSIEFNIEGNDAAAEHLKLIKEHLDEYLKVPVNKEITDTSNYIEWIADNVKVSIYSYEKYSVKKLKFEIAKL
ncbi:MAG: hypothetical protein ACTHMI_12110 [Mucilaginibacter sp.]